MKKPFELRTVLGLVEEAVKPYPKAAMFELKERGYGSLFEQLISCLISIRTLDETTIPVSLRLFQKARTPQQLLKLSPQELEKLLYDTQYPGQKAYNMLGIAKVAVEQYGGNLPPDFEVLTSLKGVGPKCANLALGVGAGVPAVSVDVHVHRVVNRWGYVQTTTPEKTTTALEQKVPKNLWIDINRLLMPFGKQICKAVPHCSTCPVLPYCPQIGVTRHY